MPPKPGQQRNCQNDGWQIYMTQYRPTNKAKFGTPKWSAYNTKGSLRLPYDATKMSTYRVHGRPSDLEVWKVVVQQTGDRQERFSVSVV